MHAFCNTCTIYGRITLFQYNPNRRFMSVSQHKLQTPKPDCYLGRFIFKPFLKSMGNPKQSEARTPLKPQGFTLRLRLPREKPSKEKQKQASKMGYIRGLVAAELASSNPSLDLDSIVDHRRLAELVSAFKTPNHPPYASMIRNAMEKINGGGSSEKAISESIVREFEDLPLAHEAILKIHLGRLCDGGEIRLSDDERYVFAAEGRVEEVAASMPLKTKRKKGRGKARLKRGEVKGDEKTDSGDVEDRVQQQFNEAREEVELLEDQQFVIMSETKQTDAIEEGIQLEEIAELNDKTYTAAAPELQRRKLRSHDNVNPVLAVSVSEPPVLKQCGTRHSKRKRDTEKTSQAELPLEPSQGEPTPLQQERESETSNQSMRRKLRSYHKEVSVSDSVSEQKSEPQQQQAQHHAAGKRCGRGRPPKLKLDTETELSLVLRPTDSEEQPPKRRGRGRSPKPDTETSLPLVLRPTDSKEKPPKRHGRGRPPKPKPSVDTGTLLSWFSSQQRAQGQASEREGNEAEADDSLSHTGTASESKMNEASRKKKPANIAFRSFLDCN